MALPRGLRNNNPGNIRINNDEFEGEVRPSQDTSFKQFKTPAYGYRAVFVIMAAYLSKGYNTIEKIIGRWAPANENPTDKYISTVCSRTGIARDKELTALSGSDYLKIVAAISYVENGIPPVTIDVEAGFKLQNKIK